MKCKQCGAFANPDRKFCSRLCYNKWLAVPQNNAMYGKTHSKERRKKISLGRKTVRLCKICRKTLHSHQSLYCSKKCEAVGFKGKHNPFHGKSHSAVTIEGNRQKHLGKKTSVETRRRMRISAIKYRKSLDPGWKPSYNKVACKHFDEFDKTNQTKGQHAEKSGEYFIESLGYYLDYINFDLKLIMEYDERRHYSGGKLKDADVFREKEIKKFFPDFEFKRIKEATQK